MHVLEYHCCPRNGVQVQLFPSVAADDGTALVVRKPTHARMVRAERAIPIELLVRVVRAVDLTLFFGGARFELGLSARTSPASCVSAEGTLSRFWQRAAA